MGSALPSERRDGDVKRRFLARGWCSFSLDSALADWVAQTLPAARAAAEAPENAQWLRCGGTWFAGVNVLPNDAFGAVPGGPPLAGSAVDFVRTHLDLGSFSWDRAQVSICYPGYPRPMASESDAAFRYRVNRDAAHLDGILRRGPERRRFLGEHHCFILGIGMAEADPDASPMVVWEGSHEIVRETFRNRFGDAPPHSWSGIDVTDTYHEVRRRIFDQCRRVAITARMGEAYLVHRLALHGVAPWAPATRVGSGGRMIVYFRPETGCPGAWLAAP